MKLLILADDFTGALDTGVQLSKYSIPTVVMSNPHTPPNLTADCQVLVINTNIRHAKPQEAYACILELLYKYMDTFTHIYLKTDSVLRGNISAAFAAALHVLKKPLCFIPAFPDLNRTTKGAIAYVNGELLEHSVFKDDPRTPTLESSIPDILNHGYPINCQTISQENYQFFTETSLDEAIVYLFDCETNEQLQKIGDLIAERGLYNFTAGCAGFASTFVAHLPFVKTPFRISKSNSPVLFVSGSANAVTLKQLDFARHHGYTVIPLSENIFSTIDYTTSTAEDKELFQDFKFIQTIKDVTSNLLAGHSVILATATETKELFQNMQNKAKDFEKFLHNYIARYTSTLVKSILEEMNPSNSAQTSKPSFDLLKNLVVFGGDMVSAILEQLSCHQVRAAGEITTGVPLCEITYQGHVRNLVTKSGGFGEADIIPVIEQYLRD